LASWNKKAHSVGVGVKLIEKSIAFILFSISLCLSKNPIFEAQAFGRIEAYFDVRESLPNALQPWQMHITLNNSN
jgi:hypothetical protein